ncbi:MAG: AmmeMemoRadiSam system protein A [Thermodesulfovibrionales bacterium]
MHPVVELAKKAVEEYVKNKRIIPVPETLTQEMKERAGVFVSIKKQGQLRGCIGTFMPSCRNVAEEIIRNAICSATEDPRFPPVQEDELESLSYSVDILSTPEKVKDLKELDPKRYGVIVASGGRRGLLLPNLEGVDTVEEQLRIARLKAGIFEGEKIDIFRFEVRRYH